jgi:hypothetical protein
MSKTSYVQHSALDGKIEGHAPLIIMHNHSFIWLSVSMLITVGIICTNEFYLAPIKLCMSTSWKQDIDCEM